MKARPSLVGSTLTALLLLSSSPVSGQLGRLSDNPLSGGWRMEVTGGTTTTQVSGDAGAGDADSAPNDRILSTIRGGERSDRPCILELLYLAFDLAPDGDASVRSGTNNTSSLGSGCGAPDKSVGVPVGSVITGLRVCQRQQNGRLKGVAIRFQSVGADGRGSVASRSYDRPNCNEWSRWVECPGDQVATGVVAHWRDAAIVGMALQCRSLRMVAQQATRQTAMPTRPPSLQLDRPSAGDRLSGTNGVVQTLRAPDGMALKGITFGERSDNPCYLRAEFSGFDGTFTAGSRTFDRCNGSAGSLLTVTIPSSLSTMQWASGLQICQRQQNDRLKGVRLLGSRVDDQGTHYDPAIQEVEERPNCNQWAAQAFCTQGSVITEVQVHYRATGNRPAEITGVALNCAQAAVR